MTSFSHPSFRIHSLTDLPLNRDIYVMDEIYLEEWEREWLRLFSDDQKASPYEVGFITPIHIEASNANGADIAWYANTHDRFHRIRTILPASVFRVGALPFQYEKRPTIFVDSAWLKTLHLRSNSIFMMVDVMDMTRALQDGRIKHAMMIGLRDALDTLSDAHPEVSFISFADSLLIKTNWTVGMVNSGVTNTYAPEAIFDLFFELQGLFRRVLGLDIYGVLAQGSNEYYEDPLLHISKSQNHISLNSLGLPFAQINLIESAARRAIRAKEHAAVELYVDEDLFLSLRFAAYDTKKGWPSAAYQPKLAPHEGKYFFGSCADFLGAFAPKL